MAEVLVMQEQFTSRPPGMAEVPVMQEQFASRPPGMAEVLVVQEHFASQFLVESNGCLLRRFWSLDDADGL